MNGHVQENYGPIFLTDNFIVTPWTAPYARIDSLAKIDNSHTMLQGVSLPLATVTIQATTTLKVPFTFLTTVPVAADGTFQFEDAGAALFSTRFYRAIYP